MIWPIVTVLTTVFLFIIIVAYVLRVIERPFQNVENIQEFSFLNSAYFTVITMCTVGYGDLYPRTWIGKIMCMLIAIAGTFVMSLFIVTLW